MTIEQKIIKYCEENPYLVYGDYRDTISDEMAEALLAGNLETFDELFFEWEVNASDYACWKDWEKDFLSEFENDVSVMCEWAGYLEDEILSEAESFEELPEKIKELVLECRFVDCSDYMNTCLRQRNGNIVASLYKQNGDMIEFPSPFDHDKSDWRKMQRYLKDALGIDGLASEATYSETYLRVLGKIDMLEVYQNLCQGKRPLYIAVSDDDFFHGHDYCRGSGTADVKSGLNGKTKTFKATFRIDNDRYGVDATYGFCGSVWRNELSVIYK